MDRSGVRAAAISWLIACGLFCGGAGTLGTAQAGADPGTVGSSRQSQDATGGADSNGSGPARNDAKRDGQPGPSDGGGSTSGGKAGTGTTTGPVLDRHRYPRLFPGLGDSDGDGEAGPGLHWPWPPCEGVPRSVVLSPRPSLRGIQAPRSIRSSGGGGGGNGGGIAVTIPPPTVPGQPGEPTPVDAGGANHEPIGTGEPPIVEMPPIVGLPPVLEAPLRPASPSSGAGPAAETGSGGRSAPARERPPASVGNATEPPPSSRVGYPEYLREAKTGEVAALALPGLAGLLVLTALGGVVGYRQARAGHLVRAAGTARFLQ